MKCVFAAHFICSSQTSLHHMWHECELVTHLRILLSKQAVWAVWLNFEDNSAILLGEKWCYFSVFHYLHRKPSLIIQQLRCVGIADLIFLEYVMAFAFLYFHLMSLLLFTSWVTQTYTKRFWTNKEIFSDLDSKIMG